MTKIFLLKHCLKCHGDLRYIEDKCNYNYYSCMQCGWEKILGNTLTQADAQSEVATYRRVRHGPTLKKDLL